MPSSAHVSRKIGPAVLLGLGVLLAGAACVVRGDGAVPQAGGGAGTLAATGPMQTARSAHTATLLPGGHVLITGGFDRNRERDPFAEAERYDPARGVFTAAGAMTTGRQSHSATLLPDGTVLLAGGYDGTYLASAERYDPAAGTFTPTGSLHVGRIGHRETLLADGTVLVTGGDAAGGTLLASAERYDPRTGRFTQAGTMNTPRAGHTQTLLSDGRVLITGGSEGRGRATRVLASAEIYDPATGAFTPTGDLRAARHKHAAVLLADGRVLVVGGSDESDRQGRYDSAELFDPATGTFRATGRLHSARFKLRAAVVRLQDGTVLVAGGAETVEVYDPAAGHFTAAAGRLDADRYFSTATLLQDGSVLIAGGYDQRIESTARAWRYRP